MANRFPFRAVLICMSVAMLPTLAGAQSTTYKFTGPPLTGCFLPSGASCPLPGFTVTGTITYGDPLPPNSTVGGYNGPLADVGPVSWTFTDGVHTFTQNSTVYGAVFIMQTDANGNIDNGYFDIQAPIKSGSTVDGFPVNYVEFYSDQYTYTFDVGFGNYNGNPATPPESVIGYENWSFDGYSGNGVWTGSGTCGVAQAALIQQYRAFRNGAGVIDILGDQFVPSCLDITNNVGSKYYSFSKLNYSNHTDSSVALLHYSLLDGQGVFCYYYPTLIPGCGLDAWVLEYGATPVPTITSGYRPPADQQRIYAHLKKPIPPPPGGRHMFGDAVDLAATSSNWNALVNAAIDRGADFTESDPGSAGYDCGRVKMKCVHADWRFAVSFYAQ